MNHDEVGGDNYKVKKDEWLDYVKQDVLCTAFSYARYCKAMQEIVGFSMKDCLSLPGSRLNYFNSLRRKKDETIYTYNDKHMRGFERQAAYRGRVCAFNQNYKSKNCDVISKTLSEKVKVKGIVYDTIEAYITYKNKHFKIVEKEFESKFDDYRDEDVDEKENYINKKLGELPIHKLLQQLSLKDFLWDNDANSFYPSSMWDEKSIYPRIETGYVFTEDMKDELFDKLNTGSFNQGSAILKIKYYNPENLIVQHLPVKDKEKQIEINRMRNGHIIQNLTSVDILENVKIVGKVIEIYEGVIY